MGPITIHVHEHAMQVWPALKGLLEAAIQHRSLPWALTAAPDPPPERLDFAVMTGRSVEKNVKWLAESKPSRLIIAHAGVPTTVSTTIEQAQELSGAAVCQGGVYNIHHNARATGELGLSLLLSLSRRVTVAHRMCQAGDWTFKETAKTAAGGCRLVYNSTTLIIGLGAVGRYVAAVLRAMGGRVVATRRSVVEREVLDNGVEVFPSSQLGDLLGEAAAVVITAPLTAETEGLLGAQALARCRDGCNIVNIGRAEIVDEDSMWQEVKTGRLAYASDVWWNEPKPGDAAEDGIAWYGSQYGFHELDNVIVTPHYAGAIGLEGIEEERAEAVIETAIAALSGELKPLDLSQGY